VKSVGEFKKHVKDDLRKALTIDSDKKLEIDIIDYYINKLNLPLPDDFLKRWLLKTSEGKITEQQIEEEYEDYAKSLRWQLIENQIAKENNIKIEPEEALTYTINLMKMQVAQYGGNPDAISEEELKKSAAQILANQDEAKKIYERIFAEKIMNLIKEKAKIKEKEVSYEEFAKLVSGKSNKFSELFNNLKKSFKK
jgi:trigger factor